MTPQLDLTHSKIMVVPARMNLRRAPSYRDHEKSIQAGSSSSSRFNFRHLVASPPPSPSLPSLVPRHKRSISNGFIARPHRLFRLVLYTIIISAVCYAVLFLFGHRLPGEPLSYIFNDEYEMVGQDELPDFPTPIVVKDHHGHSKWTVSIPQNYKFPLSIDEYSEMMGHCRETALRSAGQLDGSQPKHTVVSSSKGKANFVDVAEAERTGLLHSPHVRLAPKSAGNLVGTEDADLAHLPVCDNSLTYVLESTNAGLGQALMAMWTFYGLAQSLNRPFFIDDSQWAYGTYTDIFAVPPTQKCRPPPRHHMIPCPAEASHLVVSSATAPEMLPALLAKAKVKQEDSRRMFDLARSGYQALFKLNYEDGGYVESRVWELQSTAKAGKTSSTDAPIVGLHVRHGDRHPLEYQYRDTYIPGEVFLGKAQDIIDEHFNQTQSGDVERHAITLLASDDPMVQQEAEMSAVYLAQERIQLASKDVIEEVNDDPNVLHRFVDETFGWEGGFFAPMFWNLGVTRHNNAADAPNGASSQGIDTRPKTKPSEQTVKLRSFIGRAYMMDLAVLAGASDKVVCAVSATGCRLLAVMLGWEDGIVGGRWVNIDGEYPWRGLDFE